MILLKIYNLYWIRIRNLKLRIRQEVSDTNRSGSTTQVPKLCCDSALWGIARGFYPQILVTNLRYASQRGVDLELCRIAMSTHFCAYLHEIETQCKNILEH
jgi:hypothetical protein